MLKSEKCSEMANQAPSFLKNKRLWQTLPFINGKFVNVSHRQKFEVRNPANGQVIALLPSLNAEDVHEASRIASHAFNSWKLTTPAERGKILKKMAHLMEVNRDDLASIMTLECGKPFAEAKGEMMYAQSFYDFYSEEMQRCHGEIIPSPTKGKKIFTIHQPIGAVGLITPWNFPSAMITRKVGPALAAGCTAVVKPSEETPLSALALCAIAEEAGLPPGVLNCLPVGRDNVQEAGYAMSTSRDLRKISFTGSTAVGKILMRDSADTVKRLSLELGGNAPFIVFDDADLHVAVSALINSKFRNAGQACIASNRIFVQDKVYDHFAQLVADKVKKSLICGDGFSPETTVGPLVNKQGLEKVARQVRESVEAGGKVLVGGDVDASLNRDGGFFYRPTVLTEMNASMPPFVEETFGPVVPLLKFHSEEEVIHMANNTRAGLAGYVCTNSIARSWRVAESLEVGMVGVNEGAISSVVTPFGGVKDSGLGREGSSHGLQEYLEVKAITFGAL